jgi:hypothetical protein
MPRVYSCIAGKHSACVFPMRPDRHCALRNVFFRNRVARYP